MPLPASSLRVRRWRAVPYLAVIVAVPLLIGLLAPLASAQTDPAPRGPRPPRLTDAQKACLAAHGVQPPAVGQRSPSPPTEAQREAFRTAAQACGLPARRGKVDMVPLTDAQRTCLTQHGVTVPAPGRKPSGPLTEAQRDTLRAAAQACGLPTPKDPPPSASS